METYVPQYMAQCTTFFAPVKEACGKIDLNSSEFETCIAPFNESYQLQLAESFNSSGAEPLDLESLKLKPIVISKNQTP